ncbi:hypothetical protein [Hymenobacter metallicola]|uniref:hypothetical protein n=1 Tax=Hymenobacter metallicola TaxID=2563114 RepID=UPI0037441952
MLLPVQLAPRLVRQDAATHSLTYELVNASATPAVAVRLTLLNDQQQPVLPAYFSNGYFTLLPGEYRIINGQYPATASPAALRLLAEAYNGHYSFRPSCHVLVFYESLSAFAPAGATNKGGRCSIQDGG